MNHNESDVEWQISIQGIWCTYLFSLHSPEEEKFYNVILNMNVNTEEEMKNMCRTNS